MAKARFEYVGKTRTVESVMRRGQQAGRGYDSYVLSDFPMWKVREGESVCRILPPTWSRSEVATWGDMWDIRVFLHYGVGPDNSSYLCLDKMKGEECPVCNARRQSTDADEQDQLRASERRLVWVIDRKNESAGPQVWAMPPTLYRDIVKRQVDTRAGNVYPLDSPEEGYDLIFTREGADKRTKYVGVDLDRKPSPLASSEKTQDRWLDYIKQNPLPEVLQYYDYDYIEKVLFGQKKEEEEEAPRGRAKRAHEEEHAGTADEEDEKHPTRTRFRRYAEEEEEEESKPQARRGSDREPDESEEEDEPVRRVAAPRKRAEEEEQEEEEERPRGGRHTLRGKNGGEEEEEGSEAGDEEGADEAPPPRRGGGRLSGLQARRGK